MKQCPEQMSLFSAEASLDHASHFPLPGSDEARKMTVTSGRKCCELLRTSDPLGSLVRTLLESSVWRSTRCLLTWKPQGTKQGRLLFRLAPSTPRTGETDAQLFPTVRAMESGCYQYSQGKHDHPVLIVKLWPTPAARDYKGANSTEHLMRTGRKNHTSQLSNMVKLFPTPLGNAGAGPSHPPGRQGAPDLQSEIGGQLNPDWVEWLMGFPVGWTEV